jgi:anti-anti-sigma factor
MELKPCPERLIYRMASVNTNISCAPWQQQQQLLQSQEQEPTLKLDLEVIAHESTTIVLCKGRVTYREEAAALSAKVAELVLHSRQVVLDLSGVDMIDSAGLGELIVALMSGQITGCTVKLASPRKHVRQVLDLTNLSTLFEIHPTLEEALISCKGQVA